MVVAGSVQAKRPVLYVGGGCLDSAAEIRELVSRTGIPVVQTLMGLGTFPESDPLALQARRFDKQTSCTATPAFSETAQPSSIYKDFMLAFCQALHAT
jgi:glyoxylate carboligase